MLKELLLYTFFIFVIYSCHHSDIYTYNCNDIGFTFSMQETDSCDVLVLNGTDTIFLVKNIMVRMLVLSSTSQMIRNKYFG